MHKKPKMATKDSQPIQYPQETHQMEGGRSKRLQPELTSQHISHSQWDSIFTVNENTGHRDTPLLPILNYTTSAILNDWYQLNLNL